MKVLIIIPAYNEAASIERVVDELIEQYPQYDYVVINDGSRDDTAAICRRNGYNLLDLPMNLGLAGAFQTGIRYAYERGYDAAVQFDGDGQHNARYIQAMTAALREKRADIVIASRFKEKKKPFSARMLGNTMIQFAIRATTGVRISDPTSGMRLFNRRILRLFSSNMNFGPEPDTIAYLLRCGSRVEEVQAEMNERTAGESYLSPLRSIVYMTNMFFSIILIQFAREKVTS
ncbi:MAG: glycosyltransferase family 2 protein [Eubacteriales bacterium]|nr:glycosyltransferase family 2 protein [Eubacteriales bacterium]